MIERIDMPIPKAIGRLNRVGANRVIRPFARHLPGFGVVVHRGRRSGRNFETPVNVFRTTDGYLVALTYGPQTDWTRNVLAAGGCTLRTRGSEATLTEPRVVHDPDRRGVPVVVRELLGLIGVTDFLVLRSTQ